VVSGKQFVKSPTLI